MSGSTPGLAQPRILVVNDDRRLAASVQGLLIDEGYDVAVAFDGNEALLVLAQWTADLVLLDLIMPGVDGWSFLRKLSRQADRDQPLVLVWSVVEGDALARARQLGAAECLRRETTDPDALLEAIARLLHAPRAV
jgi:CheY-like chemotaxis protein